MRRVLLVSSLAIALIGCGGDDDAPSDDVPDDPPATDQSPATDDVGDDHAPPPDPPPGRLVRLTGTVTIDGAAGRPGMELDAEQVIEVPEEGRAVIQLRDGGRLEVDGGSVVRLVEDAAAQMLLIRGSVYAAQAPEGNAPRPPLRVVSPSATVEIGQSGEIYLVAFEWGGSWMTVLGGAAAVTVGDASNQRRLRVLELSAGRAVAVPDRIAEPTEGPSRLTAARAAAVQLAATAPETAPDASTEQAALASEAERLDQALRWLETETRRGHELTTGHREAVREGNTEEAGRLQRELVGHSQNLYRLRRLATARWERVRARALRLALRGQSPQEDPVAARRDRIAGLLGH